KIVILHHLLLVLQYKNNLCNIANVFHTDFTYYSDLDATKGWGTGPTHVIQTYST
ncbi:hypothetical protein ACJX0J_022729, partial [Zea mays]